LDLRAKLAPIWTAILAAFVRTIWTLTPGVSDPARRLFAASDATEAGSLTPLSASIPRFFSAALPA
jgi:hypothetical protein